MGENPCLCNGCGRPIESGGDRHEDALRVRKEWGYFSTRDLEVHEFNLCEKCYNHLIGEFVIPVTISPKVEVLNEEKSFS